MKTLLTILTGIILGIFGSIIFLIVAYIATVDGWFEETDEDVRKRKEKAVENFWKGWDNLIREKGMPHP